MNRGQKYIVLTFRFHRDDENEDVWIGECVELGVGTYGDSLEEVQSELQELVTLHIGALEHAGERERVFKENNVVIRELTPAAPAFPRAFSAAGLVQENRYELSETRFLTV